MENIIEEINNMDVQQITYQRLKFSVTAPGQEITIEGETNKLYKNVTGINFVTTDDKAGFSEIQLDIGSKEVTPDGFEVFRWRLNPAVPADFQYKTIRAEAAGSKIKGRHKDFNLFGTTYPYTLIISLRLENDSPKP